LSTHKIWVVGPGGAWATTSSIRSTRYRPSKAVEIHCAGKFCEFQTVSGSPSVAKCTESSPDETRPVASRATFGLSGGDAGDVTGVGAAVEGILGATVGVAVRAGRWLTVGAAVGCSISERAAQEVKVISVRSRVVKATAVLMGGSSAGIDGCHSRKLG